MQHPKIVLTSICIMESSKEISLNRLNPLQCGIVCRITAPDDETDRLMAMGVCGDRIVELVQRGDPLIIRVYGTRVGVSARLAERIMVKPCSSDSHHLK